MQDLRSEKKLKDLEYIKKFSTISISGICETNKINRANLLNNKSTQKNAKIVREEIESEIAKLYIKENRENEQQKNDSL